jgi:hypothetical protein
MRSLLLDIQLTPNNRPTPSTTVIRMHIQPRNHFRRSQHHRQLQFCVPLVTTDGTSYLAMFRQPVVVLAGGKETMQGAHARAHARGLPVAIFTSELFTTGNDSDNRAAVQAVSRADLDLVGIAVYARRNVVDKVLNGARIHP